MQSTIIARSMMGMGTGDGGSDDMAAMMAMIVRLVHVLRVADRPGAEKLTKLNKTYNPMNVL